MKVLMTTDTIGGVWTYSMELAGALGPRGVQVVLATMGAPLTQEQARAAAGCGVEVYESEYKLEWMEEPWEDVERAGRWLLGLEERTAPDLVHLNGYVHGGLPWRAPVLVVAHSCVLSWWWAVKNEPAPPEWDRYRAAVGRGLHGAGLVLSPTRAMLRETERCYGSLERSGVVLNGRDASLFPSGENEPFIFSAGRLWDEAKNVRALDAVAERIAWPIHVAGARQYPEAQSDRVLPKTHLNCLGPLPPAELARWLGRASIYALPARYEPFGLSALEAALAGCALVLGDIPTLREVWGDAAVFVDSRNTAALEGALNDLIEDEDWRERLARRAFHRARQLTPQRMAEGYLGAYRGLLGAERKIGVGGDLEERVA